MLTESAFKIMIISDLTKMYQKHNYNLTMHLNGIQMKAIPKYAVVGNWLCGSSGFHQNKIFNFLLRGWLARLSKVRNESFRKRNELLLRMFSKTFGNKSFF